jgi:HSP20 family protein
MLMEQESGGRWPDVLFAMRRAQDQMNRLFAGVGPALSDEFPLVNVWTNPEGAVVMAQIPGVSTDQLEVTVHQDIVTLRGKRDPEPMDDDVIVHRQERPYGPFVRSVVMPFRVDAEKVSASFSRGVLTLQAPRPESDKPRQVKIAHA